MPVYQYHCHGCGAWFDRELGVTDVIGQDCPECGVPSKRSFKSVRLTSFADARTSTSPVVDYFWETGNAEVFDAQKDVRRAQKTGVFEKTGKYTKEDLDVARSHS